MSLETARIKTDTSGDILKLAVFGDWRASNLGAIDTPLREFGELTVGRDLVIDLAGLGQLDTAGAMMIQRTFYNCEVRTHKSAIVGADTDQEALLRQVLNHLDPCPIVPPTKNAFVEMLYRVGSGLHNVYINALELLNFIGLTLVTLVRVMVNPKRWRPASIIHHMEEAGLNAVPIVALMSFMIGAVVAFMGAKVLQQFNASVFVVDLVALAIMREFGVLLAAILVAGRSGSAFTAQLGSMKIREEIDALQVIGLDPIEVLIIPRAIALVVMLPVLAFLGAYVGLIGGGLVAWVAMDISPAYFIARMQDNVGINNFWSGMIKAPFFAFVIAVIGCFQGMEVEGSAESLGQKTTLSVVQSLFLVILLDAFFAMFFLELNF